jgi:hypothetical protein
MKKLVRLLFTLFSTLFFALLIPWMFVAPNMFSAHLIGLGMVALISGVGVGLITYFMVLATVGKLTAKASAVLAGPAVVVPAVATAIVDPGLPQQTIWFWSMITSGVMLAASTFALSLQSERSAEKA